MRFFPPVVFNGLHPHPRVFHPLKSLSGPFGGIDGSFSQIQFVVLLDVAHTHRLLGRPLPGYVEVTRDGGPRVGELM
jgi:hypothetical protein